MNNENTGKIIKKKKINGSPLKKQRKSTRKIIFLKIKIKNSKK